jgi:hypothetical protein
MTKRAHLFSLAMFAADFVTSQNGEVMIADNCPSSNDLEQAA